MTEKKVELLVLTTCFQCKALKNMLDAHNIEYKSTDVDLLLKEERDELFRKMEPFNKKKAFPVTFIGNKAIVGFQKELILSELGLHDGR